LGWGENWSPNDQLWRPAERMETGNLRR
jgi:hypothetical protein